MKITIESTPVMVVKDGVTNRIYKGIAENGVVCNVYVSGVEISQDNEQSKIDEFTNAGLKQTTPPKIFPFPLFTDEEE